MSMHLVLWSAYLLFAFYFTKETEYDYWKTPFESEVKRISALMPRYWMPAMALVVAWMALFRFDLEVGLFMIMILSAHFLIDYFVGGAASMNRFLQTHKRPVRCYKGWVLFVQWVHRLSPFLVLIAHWLIPTFIASHLVYLLDPAWIEIGTIPLGFVTTCFAFVFAGMPVNYLLKNALKSFRPIEVQDDVKRNAGSIVGLMERWLLLICLIAQQYAAAGLVLTAKSVARYDRISKDPVFAEYYLLGTLFSVLATIAIHYASTLIR